MVGLCLGIAGSALDFISGSPMVQSQTMYSSMTYTMMNFDPSSLVIPLNVLGIIVLATSLLMITPLGAGRMGIFGALMTAYGAIMLLVGFVMRGNAGIMFPTMSLLGLGMLLVGVLMAINGVAMIFSSRRM